MTQGLDKAADYIAAQFKALGLKPGNPDGTYFQPFQLPGAIQEGPATLVLRGPKGQVIELKQGTHFYPMGLGSGGSTKNADASFAGYGIKLLRAKYNDYEDLDVRDKVVFVIRDAPRAQETRDNPLKQMAPFTRKLAEAQRQGAAALVFVNDRQDLGEGDNLLDFRYTALSQSNAKIPLIQLKRSVLENLIKSSMDKTLTTIEADIDRRLQPQSFDLTGWSVTLNVKLKRGKIIDVKNVVGILEGEGPLADQTVVVGAHYDHLGSGGQGGSLARLRKMAIHHGADDNGSGTTAMLELARRFANMPERQGRRIVFCAFSAEELGLIGSRFYSDNPLVPLNNTVAMFNLDMVGRLQKDAKTGKDKLLIEGAASGKGFSELVDEFNKPFGFQLAKSKGMPPNSDHYSFYRKKIPVLFFWTGIHKDYHRPTDTAEKINLDGMRRIVAMSEKVIDHFATVKEPPVYQKVQTAATRPRPGNAPRLGIVPGYGDDGEGLLVDDVREGQPAADGGILAGDRIIEMAGKPVRNIQNYMTIMRTKKKGDDLAVTVLRKKEKVKLKLKLK